MLKQDPKMSSWLQMIKIDNFFECFEGIMMIPHLAHVGEVEILNVIKDVSKEIAVVFAPQEYAATESLLQLKAKDAAMRLRVLLKGSIGSPVRDQ